MEPSLHCQSLWCRIGTDTSVGHFPQARSYCWAVVALLLPQRGFQQTSPWHILQGNNKRLSLQLYNISYCSWACGIDLGDSYVVTGGYYSLQRVAQYSLTGEVTDLADLQQGRAAHSCTSFIDDNGVMVSLVVYIMKYLIIVML